MPVARPQYGRKLGPSVVPATPLCGKAAAKANADLARKTSLDAAVAVAVVLTSIG
jgi:hypothetical protein